MSIELLLFLGFLFGLLVGVAVARRGPGCVVLLAVPVAMFAYIYWWQGENPDKLRSTSALDFIFGPLWPSLGAIGGWFVGKLLRPPLRKE